MKHEYLPEGWNLVQLGKILKKVRRPIDIDLDAEYRQIGIRSYGKGIFHKKPVLGRDLGNKSIFGVKPGDFVLNIVFAWEGAVAVVTDAELGMCGSHRFPTFVANRDMIDLDYLLLYFKSQEGVEQLGSVSPGGAGRNKTLSQSDFLRLRIPLPPVDEQCRIVEVVRDIEVNIARVEGQISAAQQVKHGVMQRLFTYGLAGEGALTRRSDFGHIPYHWQIAPLEQCAYVQTGAAKGRNFNGSRVISVPYLRVANVQDGYLDLSEIKYIDIREEEFDRYSLQPGDVLLTEGGDLDKLGRGFIWHGEIPHCIHQNHVFAVRVNPENLIPEYLSYLVQSDYGRAYFLSAAKQTTNLASVNSTQLKVFPVLLPNFDEQREITAILSDHDATIRTLQVEAESLREVKRGLMQKLLSGQVRV